MSSFKVAKASLGTSAADFLPKGRHPTLPQLRRAAGHCQGCELYRAATQTVFGEGGAGARVMCVGEQPGDQEDRQGRPFVGPAGRILDKGLADVGIDREDVYITNAVKHFYWTPRGKRRLHAKPKLTHIQACRPWLDAELQQVEPEVVVCLGATAAQALLGRAFRVTKDRGRLLEDTGIAPYVVATVHPSSILRVDEADRAAAYAAFVADWKVVAAVLKRRLTVRSRSSTRGVPLPVSR